MIVQPQDVRWRDGLNIVIIAGCSVLDINDYNDNYTGSQHNDSPGKCWATTGPSYLLGYNFSGPSDRGGGADIARDAAGYLQLNPITAWYKANLKAGAWNACAIENTMTYKDYYYFETVTVFKKALRAVWTRVSETEW